MFLWYIRCSNMQRHRAILHLFECTIPTKCLSVWYTDTAICKDLGRFCTFLNTQHQFCPCDMSNAAICNDIGDIALFGIHNTRSALVIIISDAAICKDIGRYCTFFVLVMYQMQQHRVCACDISDAAICNDLGDILPFWVHIWKGIGDIATFLYTPPVLSLRHIRCSNMQRHRAILHLFEYTTPVLSLWHIGCSNMQKLRRYCTFLNTQHQFCPCEISDAAICKYKGDISPFWIHNTSFVLLICQAQEYANT